MKPFNPKLRDRENNYRRTLENLKKLSSDKRIWFHAASMGEFEQAKPVIELIKENHPDIDIFCSFFSPSGYNNQKNYPFANAIVYMPFDTRKNAEKFIDIAKPDAAIFVRYEVWRNYLEILNRKHIPTFLIDATQPGSKFIRTFPILKQLMASNYKFFNYIFTVGTNHSDYFKKIKSKAEILTLSDTRFDRIINNVETSRESKILTEEIFDNNEFILVAGSSWSPDEKIIIEAVNKTEKKIKVIFVPHEPTPEHIEQLSSSLSGCILLSEIHELISQNNSHDEIRKKIAGKHIIVDSIGKLLKLYANADAAYIGGAFGVGVHSVTEPAGYGIPLSTGPKMTNSHDAIELRKEGALTVVYNASELLIWMVEIMSNKEIYGEMSRTAKEYVYKGKGSSKIIADKIINSL